MPGLFGRIIRPLRPAPSRRFGLPAILICLALTAIFSVFAILTITEKPPLLDKISFSRIVLDKNGQILKISLSEDQKYRLRASLDAIAPEAALALLHYEDRYFYQHPGVNPAALARAACSSLFGQRKMGASTITMQVARLRFKLDTTHVAGKLAQMWLALKLEYHYSKREILEAYFNLAPYGGNIEGVEAAARVYFDKPASRLTDLEAHALAVVPQNPAARNPVSGKDFDNARFRLEADLRGVPRQNAEIPPLKIRRAADLPFLAPHLSMELLGKAGNETVFTGIERGLQIMLRRAVQSFVKRGRRHGINNAAAILVDCESMQIRALVGSADFFAADISGQVDGTAARRSPGSTLKPFIYALALDQGLIHPHTILADSPRSFGGYDPENFDQGFRGPIPAHEALKSSRNLPAISLSERLAEPGLYGFLQKADIHLPKEASYYGLALALGGAEISMRQLAGLYAMLANKGFWQPPRAELSGNVPAPKRLVSPEAAWLTLNMLGHETESGQTLTYKTGTSNGFRDAWTAGIAGKYALVVWVGNFDNRSNPLFVGAKTALPLYEEIVHALASRRRLAPPPSSPPPELNIEKVAICSSTGDPDRGHCPQTENTWFITGVTNAKDSGILRPVLIDRQTGLRACQPDAEKNDEIWMEFWPGDILEIFAKAGINKPVPPPWLPACLQGRETTAGKAPRIVLPKKNVVYHRRISEGQFRLPLQGQTDSEAKSIHWYAGKRYIGSSKPGEILFWQNPDGAEEEIVAVDNLGRSSKRKFKILALP